MGTTERQIGREGGREDQGWEIRVPSWMQGGREGGRVTRGWGWGPEGWGWGPEGCQSDAGRGSTNITSISIFDANVFKDRFLYQRGHHSRHPAPTLPHSLITSPPHPPFTLFLSASLTVPLVTPPSLTKLPQYDRSPFHSLCHLSLSPLFSFFLILRSFRPRLASLNTS